MTWWTLDPRDPVMIRDGRPFGLDTEGARSLDFPTASSVAGTLRARIGFAAGSGGRFGLTRPEVDAIEVVGPLLADVGETPSLWCPAPQDCVLYDEGDESDKDAAKGWRRFALAPSARWDEPCSLSEGLLPVAPAVPLPHGKPSRTAPRFWRHDALRAWLAGDGRDRLDAAAGREGLKHERRVHVAIDPATGTGADGKLFQTDGLRLPAGAAFLVGCRDERLRPGPVTLGGERRLSLLEAAPASVAALMDDWPPAVDARARVVLLTPALFERGAVPERIGGASVVAAAVGRPQIVSGWDFDLRGPKPVRRCAPAGSVYWVELDGLDPEDWARRVHLRSVSDGVQDRRDGFGLAAVGVWR